VLGQPKTRGASTYTFCGAGGTVTVTFDSEGLVKRVDS
jgi:hypothetical protein